MERSPWEVEILWLLCCILLYRHHLLFVDDSICLTIAIEVDIDAVLVLRHRRLTSLCFDTENCIRFTVTVEVKERC